MFRTIGDGPSVWESSLPPELLRLPDGLAAGAKLLRTARVRADTTVISANVAYPTDSGLLARAVGKLVRTARRVQAAGGAPGTVMTDRRRAAARRMRQVASTLRTRGKLAR